MYKASQKVETVSDYIVRYVSSDTGDSSQWNLRDIFDKYKRISMNETIGMLVLRKIKNLDYETGLDMAFEYRWKNMLDKLLKMYVVIDRNTSTVVRKGTLFMDKDEYLDIDIGKLFSQDNESQIMKIDIKTSNSLYIRPLFRMGRASTYLIWAMHTISGGRDIEMLIDICNTKFEFPPEVCDSVGRDIRCIDDRFMICCMLVTARESCRLNSLELLKRVLGLEPNIYFPFQRLESVVDARGVPIDDGLSAFVWEYEYKARSDLLSYTLCAYFSICWDRKKLIEYLEDNYYSSKHMQIFFDISVFHKNESLSRNIFSKSS
ncbi:hypothetical protein AX774_g2284 [Zancudomyces culisetae]|uniref:Uncharacterized protein n=1 Tax=Zancudomyces culisetae TaxID=1213189 RepID=A0A1R1PTG3_ZANCU|nr:hypothetical protein AX774_g2284 [Zancudomyces culisetae]|eukprot:OMH84193.1 hypothetical protein AX774_g2284 [Zancudomyces culisetae]